MAKPTTPHKHVEYFDRLIATIPEIERKGAAMPYTSVNGNMFSFLSKEGLMGLRLSASDRMAFIRQFRAKPFENFGVVMHEYVTVPPALLKNTKELEPYLALSFAYAKSLKPKPTDRPKKEEQKKETTKPKIDPPKKAEPKVEKKPIAKKAKKKAAVKKAVAKKIPKKVAPKKSSSKKTSGKKKK